MKSNPGFVFKTQRKICYFFKFFTFSLFLLPGIGYKFQCGGCNGTYYSKIKRYFRIRVWKTWLLLVRSKGDDDLAIKGYLVFCYHSCNFHNFSILVTNNSDFRVTYMESLLMNRDHTFLIRTSNPYLWNFMITDKQSFII